MKRWFTVFVAAALVLSGVAWAEEKYNPGINHTGVVGEAGKYWRLGGFDKFQMPEITAPSGNPPSNTGWLYVKDSGAVSTLYFEGDNGTVTDLIAASAMATDFALTADADAGDFDIKSLDRLEFLDATDYIDGGDGNLTIVTDGTLALSSGDWAIGATGTITNASMSADQISAGNLTLGNSYLSIGTDPADAGTIRLPNAGSVQFEADVAGVDVNALAVNSSEVVLIGSAGASGVTVTPNATFTGNISAVDGAFSGNVSVTGAFKQDALVPASAAPTTITLDGAGAGGATIGGTSTGTVTLGGGATLVNLPAATDLTLAGGVISLTDTANSAILTATNNTVTTGNLISLTANAQTSGNGVSYTSNGAVLTGSAFYAGITDGAGFTGYYFRAYDGAADDFAVKRYGAVTIGGLASTDMITVTAGDLQLTAGDVDVDLGILTIDNTADEANRIARNNAVGTAAVLEVEQTHVTGGIGLLIDQKSTTAAHYGINFTSAGATHEHFTANGAAGDVALIDVTDAWTGQGFVIDAGPWVGTAGEGAGFSFASDAAATAEAGTAIKVLLRGTGADAAAIDGKGLFVEDNAAATAGSYLVKLDTQNNVALHISNGGTAADGIKFDVADAYTGQGIVADLGPWLGTSGEGFISLLSDNAATVPAGQFIRMRQLGTGQHAAAIGGTLLYMEDDATAPAAGTSYVLNIDATNIEAVHVDTGKVLVDETVTATGGVSSGSAADSFIYTDTVELSNVNIKALRATPIALVAAPGADNFVELVSAVLILDYGTNVLTETADNLVIEYNTSGVDITGAIEATGFIDAAADTIKIAYPSITDVPAANAKNLAVQLFNTGDGEYAGNAAADTTMTVKVNYRIHKAGL